MSSRRKGPACCGSGFAPPIHGCEHRPGVVAFTRPQPSGGAADVLGGGRLTAPYTGHVDLRNILDVPSLPAETQTASTVNFTMCWVA